MQTSFIINKTLPVESMDVVSIAKQLPFIEKNITQYIDRYTGSSNAGSVVQGGDFHSPIIIVNSAYGSKKVRMYVEDHNNPVAERNLVYEADTIYGDFSRVQYDGEDYFPLGTATEDWEDPTYGELCLRPLVTSYRRSEDGGCSFKYWYNYKKNDSSAEISTAFVASNNAFSFTGTKTPCVFTGKTYKNLYITNVVFDYDNNCYVALCNGSPSNFQPAVGSIFKSVDGINWSFVSEISPVEIDSNFVYGGELFSASWLVKIGNIWVATGPVMDISTMGSTLKNSTYAFSLDLVHWVTYPKYIVPMCTESGPIKYNAIFLTSSAYHCIWTNGSKIFIASMPHIEGHPAIVKGVGSVGTSAVRLPSFQHFKKNKAVVTMMVSNSSASDVTLTVEMLPILRKINQSNETVYGMGFAKEVVVSGNASNVRKGVYFDDLPDVCLVTLKASVDSSLSVSLVEVDF